MTDAGWEQYDGFAEPAVADERWEARSVPDGRGGWELLCDSTAQVSIDNGVREVRLERFTRQAAGVQNLDNPKHLAVSTRTFEIPSGGSAWFRADMAATAVNTDGVDYRDGFATFNVIDVEHKLIFDFTTTGSRIHALWELQAIPVGLVPPEESFLYVIDNPELGIDPQPGQWHTYVAHLDSGLGVVEAFVDDRMLFRTADLPAVPRLIKLGMGVLTLWPLGADGSSTSMRGQGMVARWRRISIRLVGGDGPESASGPSWTDDAKLSR